MIEHINSDARGREEPTEDEAVRAMLIARGVPVGE